VQDSLSARFRDAHADSRRRTQREVRALVRHNLETSTDCGSGQTGGGHLVHDDVNRVVNSAAGNLEPSEAARRYNNTASRTYNLGAAVEFSGAQHTLLDPELYRQGAADQQRDIQLGVHLLEFLGGGHQVHVRVSKLRLYEQDADPVGLLHVQGEPSGIPVHDVVLIRDVDAHGL
jgi:hypothetical protein